jgi:hypothetical protein
MVAILASRATMTETLPIDSMTSLIWIPMEAPQNQASVASPVHDPLFPIFF